jgi:hypothetical protein
VDENIFELTGADVAAMMRSKKDKDKEPAFKTKLMRFSFFTLRVRGLGGWGKEKAPAFITKPMWCVGFSGLGVWG